MYAHITSLEKQLHSVRESKRRQYESLTEQVHNAEKQNSILKRKLQVAHQQKEQYLQEAVDKEKQLQLALVHITASQVAYK